MESFRDHVRFLQKKALQLRLVSLKMTHAAQMGYVGSIFSCLDILTSLYYGVLYGQPLMNFDSTKPGWEGQDYFVLSKGHACAAWYAILADLGFFNVEELFHFGQMNSLLQPHPSKKIPGVALSSPSLAHGFSGAVGLAMSLKADRQSNRVFCVMGDGELQEGQVWEGALTAAHYKLDNLLTIVDWNGLQVDSTTRGVIGVEPLVEKFEAFGWKAIMLRNGHDFEQLLGTFERAMEIQRRPTVIIAQTLSGKGLSLTENKPSYHSVVLSDQELQVAMFELDQRLAALEAELLPTHA